MYLVDLKTYFDQIEDDVVTKIGLTDVFSWRGSYDEVAFSLGYNVSAKQSKELIRKAFADTFYGYKGGEYKFKDYTTVNFEACVSHYTDGEYCGKFFDEMFPGVGYDLVDDPELELVRGILNKYHELTQDSGIFEVTEKDGCITIDTSYIQSEEDEIYDPKKYVEISDEDGNYIEVKITNIDDMIAALRKAKEIHSTLEK